MNCILCNWSFEINGPDGKEYHCKTKGKIEDVTKVCRKYSNDTQSVLYSPGIFAN